MKQENVSVVKQEPAARFTLLVSGALQATLAAAAIATSTTHDVASIFFMVLGGVGLAYVALADCRSPARWLATGAKGELRWKSWPRNSRLSGQPTRLNERRARACFPVASRRKD